MPRLLKNDHMLRRRDFRLDELIRERKEREADAKWNERRKDSVAYTIRNRQRWREMSARVRAKQALCEDPLGRHKAEGVIVAASEVHHVVPIAQDASKAHTEENLMALCRSCHLEMEKRCARK